MPYTVEDGGRLNNFPTEPKMYSAKPPTKIEQIRYLVMGIAGAILVGGLVFVAFSVSSIS